MDIKVGDKLIMKKSHPCGCNQFTVPRFYDGRVAVKGFEGKK